MCISSNQTKTMSISSECTFFLMCILFNCR